MYINIQLILYTLILTYLLRKLRQASVLYHMAYSHEYGSTLVIINDCYIHVLELPDYGPYETETCSIIKIHFLVATVNLIIFYIFFNMLSLHMFIASLLRTFEQWKFRNQ
jgi:hypothetical protein